MAKKILCGGRRLTAGTVPGTIMSMTPRERMRSAMALGIPDRIPVMCQMSIGHMLVQTGIPPYELWFDGDCFAGALVSLRERYGFDGILISLHGHSGGWERKIVDIRHEESSHIVHWADGGRTVFPEDDLPQHYPAVERRVPTIVDFNPDSLTGDLDWIPVSQGLSFTIDPERRLDVFRQIRAAVGEAYSLHGEVTSPFDYFLDLFGFAGGFLALAEEPDRSKAVLQCLAEGVARIARDQAVSGLDAIKISSPYAGAGFISPGYYREFVLPFERRVAEAVRREGVFVYTHTCGAIGDRLEMMAESGVSGIECLDPPPLGNVELADAKGRIGRRLFIKGNVDPVHTLLFGTPALITEDVRMRLRTGSRGGGYILSTACSIAPRTPRENVRRLVEEAAAFDGLAKSE